MGGMMGGMGAIQPVLVTHGGEPTMGVMAVPVGMGPMGPMMEPMEPMGPLPLRVKAFCAVGRHGPRLRMKKLHKVWRVPW